MAFQAAAALPAAHASVSIFQARVRSPGEPARTPAQRKLLRLEWAGVRLLYSGAADPSSSCRRFVPSPAAATANAEELVKTIKERFKLKQPNKILAALEEIDGSTDRETASTVLRAGLECLTRLNSAERALRVFERMRDEGLAGPSDFLTASKCLVRSGRAEEALALAEGYAEADRGTGTRDLFVALAMGRIRAGDPDGALAIVRRLAELAGRSDTGVGPGRLPFASRNRPQEELDEAEPLLPPLSVYKELIRAFGKAKRVDGALATLRQMKLVDGVATDGEALEFVANAVIRDVAFVKGATEESQLLTGGTAEVAVIGLSNVGKSSLVNTAVGRKDLARKSKKPGKTREFNYFGVNGRLLYLVDLPGLGYASVSQAQREGWFRFIDDYLRWRRPLRGILHLIDCERVADISPLDLHVMEIAASRIGITQYVVLLTKCDRLRTDVARNKRVAAVREILSQHGHDGSATPVIVCSSSEKWGRDEIWMLFENLLVPPTVYPTFDDEGAAEGGADVPAAAATGSKGRGQGRKKARPSQ